MYHLIFYEDVHGNSPVVALINGLDEKAATDKTARIQLKQITLHLDVLERVGTRAGEPYVEHIKGDIWELRPGHSRIFFFGWKGNSLVLLHSYVKKTNKTPIREIAQAEREMNSWVNRNGQ